MLPHPSPARAPGDRLLGALGLAVGFVCLAAVAYVVHPAMPYNAVHLPFERALSPAKLAPEGWAFFTRDPREPRMFIFARGPQGWRPAMLAPHARLRNLLGWNRKSRAQGVESALLADGMPADAWLPCDTAVPACLDRLPAGRVVRNRSPLPTLCGSVAIVYRAPVPWAWLPQRERVRMPARILPLEARC